MPNEHDERTRDELAEALARVEARLSEAEEVIDGAHDALGVDDYELPLRSRIETLRARAEGLARAIEDAHEQLGPRLDAADGVSLVFRLKDRLAQWPLEALVASDGSGRVTHRIQVSQGRYDGLQAANRVLGAQVNKLAGAIAEHHKQRADDRCWMDDDALYEAASLPKVDRRVGDRDAMLRNCARFIDRRTEPGGWPSYAELEDRNRVQFEAIRELQNEFVKKERVEQTHRERIKSLTDELVGLLEDHDAHEAEIDRLKGELLEKERNEVTFLRGTLRPRSEILGVTAPPLSTRGREFVWDGEEQIEVTDPCGRTHQDIPNAPCARQKGHEARGFPNHFPEGAVARAAPQPDGHP